MPLGVVLVVMVMMTVTLIVVGSTKVVITTGGGGLGRGKAIARRGEKPEQLFPPLSRNIVGVTSLADGGLGLVRRSSQTTGMILRVPEPLAVEQLFDRRPSGWCMH